MRKTTKQNTTETQGLLPNLVRAILSSEVKFVLGVVTFVVGVVAPYFDMKQDMALIQKDISTINSNHLAHMQDLQQESKDSVKLIESQQNQINNIQTQVAVILEKLRK